MKFLQAALLILGALTWISFSGTKLYPMFGQSIGLFNLGVLGVAVVFAYKMVTAGPADTTNDNDDS